MGLITKSTSNTLSHTNLLYASDSLEKILGSNLNGKFRFTEAKLTSMFSIFTQNLNFI